MHLTVDDLSRFDGLAARLELREELILQRQSSKLMNQAQGAQKVVEGV
jgi:hypothetical protein